MGYQIKEKHCGRQPYKMPQATKDKLRALAKKRVEIRKEKGMII